MSIQSGNVATLATGTVSHRGPAVLLIILVCLLGFTTLVQTFFIIPNPRLFVRWFELLFAGFFLFEASRGQIGPHIMPPMAGWLFVGWLLTASISVALAVHVAPALIRHAEWLTHILFGVTLWSYLQRNHAFLKVLFIAILVGFLLNGVNLLSTWFSLPNPRDYNWFEGIPLIGHARHLGYYGLAALIAAGGLLLNDVRTVKWPRRLLVLAGLSVCWGFLFWAGGRAAIGSGVVGLALILWCADKKQRPPLAGIFVVAVGIGLWLSTLFMVNDPRMGFLFSLQRTVADTSAYGVDGFTTGRLTIWSVALRNLAGHYWFGLGPDGYRFIEDPHHGIQPHGMLVQFLVEWGIIGTILFSGLLLVILWKGFVLVRRGQDPVLKAAQGTALALVVGCILHSLVDGLFYHAQPLLFLVIGFALLLLPTTQGHTPSVRHPVFDRLTARRTLRVIVVLLGLLFLLNSDLIYQFLY